MGSLSSVLPIKRDSLLKNSPRTDKSNSYMQRPRSRFARLITFKKIDYLQWVSALAVFIFFMLLVQMFLPLSMVDKADGDFLQRVDDSATDFINLLKENGGLDFGEDVKFMPTKLMMKFGKEEMNNESLRGSRTVIRYANRKPQLAFVFADLLVDPQQILMVTVAAALRTIGYEIEVYSLENGPVYSIWRTIGVPVNILDANNKTDITVDWLNYDGILVNSLATKDVVSCLLQEPFKSVPLIWSVHEKTLANRISRYVSSGKVEVIDDWKSIFNRASVVVFPNYALPMFYAAFDDENYFVIPGSPSKSCKIDKSTILHEENLRVNMDIRVDDFVVGIVGSEFLYKGIWLEHALVLQALFPLLKEFPINDNFSPRLKILILSHDLAGNYTAAIEAIALNLNYPKGSVSHVAIDEDEGVLGITDLVIYGSFLEEQSFPDILIRAMCLEKPIIAPDLPIIMKHDKHCYTRVLEVLVNIWAYHSARRMVYMDPNTGSMQEHHDFNKRAGKMWIKWFDYNTLKSMDEDLAEEADSDHPRRRWLWPFTGEVFWQGVYEKERIQWRREKETKKLKTRAKIQRIKNRTHQKVIGKYVKPPPENSTVAAVVKVFR